MSPNDESQSGVDRYRPPRAQVADPTGQLAGGKPPIAVWISVLLLSGTIVALLVPMVSNWRQLFDLQHGLPAAAVFAVTFVLIHVVLVTMIFRSASWARFVFLGLYLCTVGVLTVDRHWDRDAMLYVAVQTVASILLFTPWARAWFRRRAS